MIRDMPAKDYHAHPALGSTSIRHLSDPDISLAEAKYLIDHDEHKRTFDVGTLAHALILEGSLDHLVMEVPYDSYRTNAAKTLKAEAYEAGLIPVNESEATTMLDPVYAMRDAVAAHPVASELLTGHEPEVSLFWEQDEVPLKARLDAYKPDIGVVADLKTARSARPNDFRKAISDLAYYIQDTQYRAGVKALTGFEPEFYFVVVQNSEPYTVTVHKLTQAALEMGQQRIDYAIRRYKQAQQTGWTGHNAVYAQDLTPWERIKNEEMMEEVA